MIRGSLIWVAVVSLVSFGTGCVTPPPPYDYSAFVADDPRSLLIVPVLNNSPEVGADGYFLATITIPLVERGYYVFPVNMSRELLADAGLSDPGLIREADPVRLAELFGADAILYVAITNWEAKYVVFTTQVSVGFEYLLRSGRTGEDLWSTQQRMLYQPQMQSSGNPIADLIVMAVTAAVAKAAPNYLPLARQANMTVATGVGGPNATFRVYNPLLPGPLHPTYAEDRKARAAAPAQ